MNYLQDHHRTSALLLHMENNPEDVFNVAIRPIDLQHAQAPPREKLPEYQPITKDNIHQNRESELAKQQGIELPPPPQDSALRAAHAATVGSGAPLPATKDQQQAFVERARRTFAQALQLAKDSPLQARAMLDEVEEEMKKISLPERIVKTTNEKLLVLRHALDSYEKKQDFSKLFTASLKRIEALAPTAALLAREQLHNLREQVNAFEKEHHVYHGHFSLQLDDVQRKYNLFDEDEIVDAIKPMLLQIKQAMLQKNVDGFLAALDGLSHFTDTLPQSTERELLTGAIEVLRQKTQHTKATT